ncbi:MAG: STAS domain-containing protein [Ignavibacteriaceae bacterium]|nr:MAG: anti-sigma factor antagonist [Chlorobiota bacterium]KXK06130.1 MAG: anti-anti-sigma regulatory factor [Chlorobi bacterium OLB4]MBV6398559.1 hypothetical protein [Ignavibacteria bacterium]MCC6885793.1 STAS domain-containing protein [Ignavibacteriales bacterium]MCE7953012.1 anti-sigma factor antagonist [Chlorobi bacterium CHB7]MDL1887150.1 STAS domain-containing protein [Ignavibacteria bacterium CHB1]MEB2329205.1 STAS domain-containing protein [Ignavibacteriaceae bacterium]OQY78043.1 M
MEFKTENIELNGQTFTSVILDDESPGLSKLSELKQIILEKLETGQKFIAIDLGSVSNMNSSGLGILISCLKSVKEFQGEFVLLNPCDKLRHIFQITKLDSVFNII